MKAALKTTDVPAWQAKMAKRAQAEVAVQDIRQKKWAQLNPAEKDDVLKALAISSGLVLED